MSLGFAGGGSKASSAEWALKLHGSGCLEWLLRVIEGLHGPGSGHTSPQQAIENGSFFEHVVRAFLRPTAAIYSKGIKRGS